MSPYPYERGVSYVTPEEHASPQTSVHTFPPVHWMWGGLRTLPPQPHQWMIPDPATPGVYTIAPPLILRSRAGIVQPVKSVPGNGTSDFAGLQAPRIPTAGDPRLGTNMR